MDRSARLSGLSPIISILIALVMACRSIGNLFSRPRFRFAARAWWERQGSNLDKSAYEAEALPVELHSHDCPSFRAASSQLFSRIANREPRGAGIHSALFHSVALR